MSGAALNGAGASCPVRDPEDGACYPSADAADLAWIARGIALRGSAALRDSALPPDEEADDDEDSEDGGALAPVDAVPVQTKARSLWVSFVTQVKGFVVRKSDSHPVSLPESEVAGLFETGFPLPLEAFPKERFRDTFNAKRGRHKRHHAIDLPAVRGTPVVAVVDGTIERLGRDTRGGKVVYLRDTTGRYTYYYAHLSRHAGGLKAGDAVRRGDRLGDVGATGHVIGGPHLHFAIFRDGEKGSASRALTLNPYLIFSSLFSN
jgi:murein DD-endopeptidase MepM/ murein hydrolase activator NlpD